MSILAVSTFNADGLNKYGRRMAETFDANWPLDVVMTVYTEGWQEEIGRAGLIDLHRASPWLSAFKARHADRKPTSYRHDAVRFSHKVAALCAAARSSRSDHMIWIDGDVVTHAPVGYDDLEGWLPQRDRWISWLPRSRSYPECGFYILNCRHHRHMEMIGRLEEMYAADGLFALPEWHDSYVLDHVVQTSGIGSKSLSGEGFSTHHPFINGPLGGFMDHCKGNRKDHGRSPKRDLRVNRREAWWV